MGLDSHSSDRNVARRIAAPNCGGNIRPARDAPPGFIRSLLRAAISP
jgi:hypothetical protein